MSMEIMRDILEKNSIAHLVVIPVLINAPREGQQGLLGREALWDPEAVLAAAARQVRQDLLVQRGLWV